MKSCIIIPARMDSVRLPNKPMLMIKGKPLVHWTYDRAKQTKADEIIIGTPDIEIYNYCKNNELNCMVTDKSHFTGTHRCNEVLRYIEQKELLNPICGPHVKIDIFVNWQCDEPLVNPEDVDKLIDATRQYYDITTLVASPVAVCLDDCNLIKVVVGHNGVAHWFSRLPITGAKYHIGIYAFCPGTLKKLGKLKPTKLSLEESLEQLTWIEYGFNIGTVGAKKLPISINTQHDLDLFRNLMEKRNEND